MSKPHSPYSPVFNIGQPQSHRSIVPRVFTTPRMKLLLLVGIVLYGFYMFSPQNGMPIPGHSGVGQSGSPASSASDPMKAEAPKPNAGSDLGNPANAGKATEPKKEESSGGQQIVVNLQKFHYYDKNRFMWDSEYKSRFNDDATYASAASIISWNMDASSEKPEARMKGFIDHLKTIVVKPDRVTIAIVNLQEVHLQALNVLSGSSWIQDNYYLTEMGPQPHWNHDNYGTVTLVDRRLNIDSVFRVNYTQSTQGRDVMYTNILMASSTANAHNRIRIGNTQLESGIENDRIRKAEYDICTLYMRDRKINGGVLVGSFPIITADDKINIHSSYVQDAWLAGGGKEDDESGMTWGHQPKLTDAAHPKGRFSRMFTIGEAKVDSFSLIGKGAKVDDMYISDHLGLMALIKTA